MAGWQLLRPAAPSPAALEMAISHALLERVAAGELPATLRLYRPLATVAFGRLDARLPGIDAAVAAARARDFEPVVRLAGGRAAAYHHASLCLDEVTPLEQRLDGLHERFEATAAALVEALASLGVDARVGEVAGEYCPGAYSVNARGQVKMAGAAQRVVRGAMLLGASIVVADAGSIRAVLGDVYVALGLPLDPATVGAVEEEAPAASIEDVERALVAAFTARDGPPREATLDHDTHARARALASTHAL